MGRDLRPSVKGKGTKQYVDLVPVEEPYQNILAICRCKVSTGYTGVNFEEGSFRTSDVGSVHEKPEKNVN